ncbi:hypothetical protein LJ725_24315 [Reyranella aquatilis]|uniref:Uncharacterized protein n=1 Tax=Reyranella aquatilis TaxID=2035356 RepID=A0ABS8L190_9HYPH|nr:hypothetical protein [Reyranella aquatilis]MCC8432112.1 hypothetical protein [Reyranella aquatilis]
MSLQAGTLHMPAPAFVKPLTAPVVVFMEDPAAPVAIMLNAWRKWLPAAIADGTAMAHFRKYQTRIAGLSLKRIKRTTARCVALPPSLPALAAGWPPDEKVRMAVLALPWTTDTDAITREAAAFIGAVVNAAGREGQAAPHPAVSFKYRAFAIVVPTRPADCPAVIVPTHPGRAVFIIALDELTTELPRARALQKALAKPASTVRS